MRKCLLSLTLLAGVLSLTAQSTLSDRIYWGGGAGFNTGTNFTIISLSPIVGYKVTQDFSVGFGIIYQSVRDRIFDNTWTNYGGNVFARYNVTRQFFTYGEFERISFELGEGVRLGYSSLNLGLGYSEPLGQRSAINVMALYNVLYNENDPFRPYDSPWVIRAGIGIGIF